MNSGNYVSVKPRESIIKRGFVDTPDGQIYYVTAGSGEPLLMLHESPRSIASYLRMISCLSENYQVFAMDTLGFGDSDKIPDSFESLADFARNVKDFMDAVGLVRPHVVGDHTGAAIAVQLALDAPERVNRMVLVGLPYWNSVEEREARLAQGMRDYPERAAQDGSHLMTIWERLVTMRIPKSEQANLTADDLELLSEQVIDRLKAGYSFRRVQPMLFGGDLAPVLPLVTQPTLSVCVTGEGSTPYTKRAREVAACIPKCEAYVFEGVDGRINHTHARELSDVIHAFLQKERTA